MADGFGEGFIFMPLCFIMPVPIGEGDIMGDIIGVGGGDMPWATIAGAAGAACGAGAASAAMAVAANARPTVVTKNACLMLYPYRECLASNQACEGAPAASPRRAKEGGAAVR